MNTYLLTLNTGILPRKTWKVIHRPRSIHIHGNVEDRVPMYRQKYQEEGNTITSKNISYSKHNVVTYTIPDLYEQIVFVDDKKLRETLLEDIDESQLPQIYGGKLELVPIHCLD